MSGHFPTYSPVLMIKCDVPGMKEFENLQSNFEAKYLHAI